jgi:hypothetical protein
VPRSGYFRRGGFISVGVRFILWHVQRNGLIDVLVSFRPGQQIHVSSGLKLNRFQIKTPPPIAIEILPTHHLHSPLRRRLFVEPYVGMAFLQAYMIVHSGLANNSNVPSGLRLAIAMRSEDRLLLCPNPSSPTLKSCSPIRAFPIAPPYLASKYSGLSASSSFLPHSDCRSTAYSYAQHHKFTVMLHDLLGQSFWVVVVIVLPVCM